MFPEAEEFCVAVVDASDKEHPENWSFQVYFSWKGPPRATELSNPQERLHFFRDQVSKFCEPWRTAALSLGDEEIIPIDTGVQFSPFRWDNRGGKVSLAGDAAHAMLPRKAPSSFRLSWTDTRHIIADRGQGLNNAMKDASDIVDALTAVYTGKRALVDAIDAYEAEMIPRGAKEVGLSAELAGKRKSARYEDDVVRMGLRQPEVKI